LKNKKALAAIVSCIIATVFLMYTEPVISDVLVKIGVSEDYIGKEEILISIRLYLCCLMSLICGCSSYSRLFDKSFPKRIINSLCLFNEFTSHLHSRPLQNNFWISQVRFITLYYYSSIPMTITGFVFLGSMEAFIFVPLMPLLIDQIKFTFLA
jgi:hypothetical protein